MATCGKVISIDLLEFKSIRHDIKPDFEKGMIEIQFYNSDMITLFYHDKELCIKKYQEILKRIYEYES
jgi:hypothetical protein